MPVYGTSSWLKDDRRAGRFLKRKRHNCPTFESGLVHSRPLRLALQLGLFQLSLGILGVLILGLFNRLLIQDIQVPAVLAAVAVGGQQLMGHTRVWFGRTRRG